MANEVNVTMNGMVLGTKEEVVKGYDTPFTSLYLLMNDVESVKVFVPGKMVEAATALKKGLEVTINAGVKFYDQKPGGYFTFKGVLVPEKPTSK